MNKVTKYKNYYTFDNVKELKEKVDTDKFIGENLSECPCDNFWAEPIEEDFKKICSFFGIENVKTYWDVSYTQGCGASFTGECYPEDINIKGLKEYAPQNKELHNLIDNFENVLSEAVNFCYKDENCDCDECIENNKINFIDINRCKNLLYCHSNTMCVESFSDNGKIYDDKINDELKFIFSDLADWLFDKLRTEFDYITSEEYLLNYIIDNEIEISEEYLKDKDE